VRLRCVRVLRSPGLNLRLRASGAAGLPRQTFPIPDRRQIREPETGVKAHLRVCVYQALLPSAVALRSQMGLTPAGGEPQWPGGGMGSPCTFRRTL
jgi:hypothetical protein